MFKKLREPPDGPATAAAFPATHALYISEILIQILRQARSHLLDHTQSFTAGRWGRTLLSVALTCRAFRDPALDELWAHLHSLDPLLMLFPSHCYDRSLDTYTRPPEPFEWTTFEHYAEKIKSLSITDSLESEVWAILDLHRSMATTSLLPSLRALHWSSYPLSADMQLKSMSLFLYPGLALLDIDTTYTGLSWEPCLKLVHRTCPQLASLRVSSPIDRPGATFVSQLVCSLDHLCCFEAGLCPISADALIHLAGLPDLHKLQVMLSQEASEACLRAIQGLSVCLPSVEDLHLSCEAPDTRTVATFLARVQSSRVQHLSLKMNHLRRGTPWQNLFAVLALRFSHESLRHITLFLSAKGTDVPAPIDLVVMQPLLQLKNMDNLAIVYDNLDVDDDMLSAIATSFPRLTHLTLADHPNRRPPRTPQATLAGLRPLALLCPQLFFCRLRVDATVAISPEYLIVSTREQNISVKELKLVGSTITDADFDRTASFLVALFPNLVTVRGGLDPVLKRLNKKLEDLWVNRG